MIKNMTMPDDHLVWTTQQSDCFSLFYSAKALQTILVLSGPQDLHKRWADKSQDLTVDWNIDSARKVLEAWQRSFTEVKIKRKTTRLLGSQTVDFPSYRTVPEDTGDIKKE